MSLLPLSGHGQPVEPSRSPGKPQAAKPEIGMDRIQLQIRNDPLSLIYKSAIEHINEALQAELGDFAIQNAAESGMDFSPEAVAERILSFATAGLSGYRERHPDQADNDQLDGFMALIRGAIDKGFEEARDILDGLGVLQGDVADNADRTYVLIQEGLDRFEQEQREPADQAD